ncbi:Glycosyltransferase involved in cell wall bisynthesis [Quadrisphaera granulorum]|uniref:Glycosyltransferase involved in cell wall biosynthesis n=1 Tax=Quadrisphaera granulorum TaxID=317664 RepID=A0A316AE04_9ACTN|nr:glycosyltransferase family 1 protein [Quadrisphaera granulorum]PWJ55114.1 glycosyltransferase involved in cell wall biosynthesis [Quadrisphaera granulorum]SZE95623.1 Glycosyltransferase involved in cell wall bisynthesis [Quadrisphaera granulorum]
MTVSASRPRWLVMATHVPASGRLGGIVRYTVEVARALQRRDDVEVHLLTSAAAAEPLAELVGGPARVHAVPAVLDGRAGPLLPPYERYLLGWTLRDSFDVVHGSKHLVPSRAPGFTAKTVLTVHDMILADRPADFPPAKRVLLQRPYAASIRQADSLICVSGATRDRLLAHHPQVADRAAVVLSATSPTLLEADPTPVDQLAGKRFGLIVGDTTQRKNVATAVSAWARTLREHPEHSDAVLALVGPPAWGTEAYGPDRAALVASGHLVQLQGIDDAALRWCYENAAVVLAPSLVEGFGLPAVEALDLGASLVTSTDPALVEVSGDRALHVPALDVAGWATAIASHLAPGTARRGRPADAVRTWDEVAEDTVKVVLHRA